MKSGISSAADFGSVWRRWDPHLHAPGTLLNDQFTADWNTYLDEIEKSSPTIEAVGITDYFCIRGYQTARTHKQAGRLPKVELLFPNVEMRLDIKTEKAKGINIHLLFSPTDADHESQIQRLLSQLTFNFNDTDYACTPERLADLGRAFSGKKQLNQDAAMSIGAEQFKTSLQDLKKLIRDPWATGNCLVAVAAKSTDGTAGLQSDDGFAALRQEIERFAHIVFSSNSTTREFWLGRGALGASDIEKRYRFLKPCLHGSDAHSNGMVGKPAEKRFSWVKGNATFDSLQQAVIEPEDRVWIGEHPPKFGIESQSIESATLTNASWLEGNTVHFNPGLVAIIGARGSGKTALVDIVAAGTSALSGHLSKSSFLKRASTPVNYVEDAKVAITWRDASVSEGSLDPEQALLSDYQPEVRYLSQQFVDGLCSSAGLAVELREEIENVVFQAIDETDRMGAETFEQLATQALQPIRQRQSALRERIENLSQQIGSEEILRNSLPDLRQRHKVAVEQIGKLTKELAALVPKGQEDRAKRLASIEEALANRKTIIASLKQRHSKLTHLDQHAKDILTISEPQRWADMKRSYADATLETQDWEAFRMTFAGDTSAIIKKHTDRVLKDIGIATNKDLSQDLTAKPFSEWPLNPLLELAEAARKEVGVDIQQQKRYGELSRKLQQDEAAAKKLAGEITHSEGAASRRTALLTDRRAAYAEVFASMTEEEALLRNLYKPLETELSGSEGALAKLKLAVFRRVDFSSWVKEGEGLIDKRRLRGKGELSKEAHSAFSSAWSKGSPDDVAKAMETFRDGFGRVLVEAIPKDLTIEQRSQTIQEISMWLYATNHISIEYGIEFDGVAIEQLSPGTRGIVLLLLYLAIDTRDRRPLIVDQPEENLDPQSVFDELVPHFRKARKRRQVIVVTHNANLVVNSDADQVIVASAQRSAAEGLPDISYTSGALEDPSIREAVCNILEGGHRAFLERERRYRFRWEDMVETGA